MKFSILIFSLIVINSCKNQEAKDLREEEIKTILVDSLRNIKSMTSKNNCFKCIETKKNFPKDSSKFEDLYGYPNGTRQDDAYEEIQLVFNCLNECYDKGIVINLITLSSELKYDADGPAYVQSNFHKYISENKDLISEIYNEITCPLFEKHLKFLFDGVENSKYLRELKKLFHSFNLIDDCKIKAIENVSENLTIAH